jgi:hypothetical protein
LFEFEHGKPKANATKATKSNEKQHFQLKKASFW